MESATYFLAKGEEPHWQRERSMKRWCNVMRTSERAEDPRPVLELRENMSSIKGFLCKATAATESRTIEFSWKGKRCGRQVRQRCRKDRQVQRCWSTCLESPNWKSSCELGGVVCTADGIKHNGWNDTIDTIESTALDLSATTLAQQEVVNPLWIAFNVDLGAGGTVWPMNADYACEKVSGPAGRMFPSSMSERLGTPIAHDWRKDVSSQTVVECWRRDRQKVTRFGLMEILVAAFRKSHRI